MFISNIIFNNLHRKQKTKSPMEVYPPPRTFVNHIFKFILFYYLDGFWLFPILENNQNQAIRPSPLRLIPHFVSGLHAQGLLSLPHFDVFQFHSSMKKYKLEHPRKNSVTNYSAPLCI